MHTPSPSPAPLSALALAMVKNEADLIEAFVRHHLHFVDLMVVIDNASSDGTREILIALQREGLPLVVFDDPIFGYFQSEKTTHVYRKVVGLFQPELVYLLDADEFLHAPDRAQLDAELRLLPPGSLGLLPWRTQVPGLEPADPAQLLADPLGCLRLRRRREDPLYYKAVVRRDPRQDSTLVIEQGNHAARLADGRPLPARVLAGAQLAHLPVRSVAQLTAKVINGWHAYLVKNRVRAQATAGYQWQQLYERVVRGEGIDPRALCMTALGYAQRPGVERDPQRDTVDDPVPGRYGALRHLGLARTDALAKVACSLEQFLRQDARPADDPVEPDSGIDLAPLTDLLRREGLRQVAALGSARPWLAPLGRSGDAPAAAPADLLLVAQASMSALARSAAEGAAQARRRVVLWCEQAASAEDVRETLAAWARQGWLPDLLPTLTARAQATLPMLRHTTLVLQPATQADAGRAAAVAEALCALADPLARWPRLPAATWHHPLQDLVLPGEETVHV